MKNSFTLHIYSMCTNSSSVSTHFPVYKKRDVADFDGLSKNSCSEALWRFKTHTLWVN